MEYAEIEPFGAWRLEWWGAKVFTLLFNSNRPKKTPPTTLLDELGPRFMGGLLKPAVSTAQTLREKFEILTGAMKFPKTKH